MTKHILPAFTIICVLLAASSCSNSKHLATGESLFTGAKVDITNFNESRKERKLLKKDLEMLVRPTTNRKAAGFRLKLTLYNAAGNPNRHSAVRNWLRNKAGEPPVLGSSVSIPTNTALIQNYLENRGYLYATATGELDVDQKKKSKAVIIVSAGPQYKLRNVVFKTDSSQISQDIDTDFTKTLLRPGNPYNLTVIKAERNRIDRMLKERGYFYFKPDHILVVADTSVGDQQLDLVVRLKHRDIPPETYNTYTINDIYIYTNYRLKGKSDDTAQSSRIKIDDYYVVDKRKTFRPIVFSRAMIFEKGDLYSLDDQNLTLSRLVNMGTFKFVKNRFAPVGDHMFDIYYYLTPYPKKSLRFELGALTQSDNRVGSKASINWRNRNTFRGAEELRFSVNGGFEAQYNGIAKQPNIYTFGSELKLSLPRFAIPFLEINTLSQYLPRTLLSLKYNYESQSNLLRINSYTASYGFSWKEGVRKEHQLYPFNLIYVRTDTLGNSDQLRNLYASLVFDGIIIGPTYEFSYHSNNGLSRVNDYFFDGLIDLSGNILGILEKADYNTNPQILFGSRYAQYVKLQPDFRFYHRLSSSVNIATRFLMGIGIPYGNSSQLPNIKQFWAGGNSDLRGFPSRLAGPGTFNEKYLYGTSAYFQSLGDLKLEMNIELRQNLYKFLNSAVFADAGNIWIYRDNAAFPGGKFTNNFYKELCGDIGAGLRFDFKILILRFDLGIPVRKPWLPAGERWVFDKISFADKQWRRENMFLNIAIGYPF